jgi:subtilase family serine protease
VASPVRVSAPVRVVAPVSTNYVKVAGATLIGSGDRITNTAPLTRSFPITVAMKLRNVAQLQAYNAKPHATMSRQELTAKYLPTAAQVDQVKAYLMRNGFRHITVSRDNLLVHAVGNTMAVNQAFRTSMVDVHTADGRKAFANRTAAQIPASLHANVSAVLGLQNVHVYHTLHTNAAPLAVPTEGTGHLTADFATIYDANNLPPATDINVGVWGWGAMAQAVADAGTWLANNPGVAIGTTNTIQVVCTDVGGGMDWSTGVFTPGAPTIGDATCGGAPDVYAVESQMDTQSILGMTGGVASLTIYAAVDPSGQGLVDALNEIISPTQGEPMAQVIDGSFGGCELFSGDGPDGDGSADAMNTAFQVGISQNQTFSISTGDSGYDECAADVQYMTNPAAYDPNASASNPANSPYVVAASGTTLRTVAGEPTWARENVWFDAGGSPSSLELAPAYQAPLTYGQYAGQRGPDIAMDANPGTGAVFYYNGGLIQVGGTSLSAPLFTGAWARILEAYKSNTTPLGFAGPHLYALSPAAFHDVTAGNNRGDVPVGGYIARPGWDWATGLGSLDVGVAAAQLSN